MNNFTTTTDKKRKSLFGFSIKLNPFSSSTNNELLQRKRHNSVNYSNFAFSLINRDNEKIETIENERDGESFRSASGKEFITHQENIRELEPEENNDGIDKQRNNNKQSFRLASGKYNNKEKKVGEETGKETGKENGLEKQKNNNNNNNNYTQSFRSISGNKNNIHHNHGSVQNLVIRRQRAAAASTTRRFLPQGLTQLSRRPSVPTSSPLSIVGRLRKSFSTASLDEEDSAFCSAESSPSCSITSSSPESSPNKTINEKTPQIAFEWKWTELQKEKIETELEHQCIHSFGHKLIKNPKLAFTNFSNSHQIMLGEMDNNVLCAEGNVQFHLLSMIAPSNKKVVNIGSPSINDNNNNNNHWFHLSPSFRPYSKNNLEISR